jgi:ABC-2 type transport system ATP-binding protein
MGHLRPRRATFRAAMSAVVEIRALRKAYGALTALDGVDLDVRAGEIFALLGPNGAGKTTLISVVAGLLRATSGSVRVLGKDVVRDYAFTRHAVGLVPQEINFDPFFTVEEALRIQAGYFGVALSEARLVELLDALDLAPKRRTNSRALSGGMKRRLLIGKALVHDPKVLFLDEPTAGVDVELRRSLWSYVRTLRDRGTTVVLTTHYLEEAEELADRVGVIDQGRLLLVEGTEALLRLHGAKMLRLVPDRQVAVVPPALAALGARLEEGGAAISVEIPAGEPFGPFLAAVAAAGVAVKDVETRRTTLEDVFVRLLAAGHADRAAGRGAP